uniref:Phage major tail tube protein n=1 Tax=Arsenophonus endosymbiont of Trialeurodes vaporariorum TaxID=235567 RepID=A0A3B0MAI4_9GAMM
MALPRKLKNMNLFDDGQSWLGVIEEVMLPKLSRKMESYRGGGMNGEAQIDLGLDGGALDMEFTLRGLDSQLYKQWGITTLDGVPLRFCGAYQRDDTGEVNAVEIVTRGRFSEIDPGSAKSGDNTQTKLSFKATYFKLLWEVQELIEIDVINLIEKVAGVDRLEKQRAALGL